MQFVKMHGIGNDYVYVDCIRQKPPGDPRALAVKVSDRRFGIGGDGLVMICPPELPAHAGRMRMFNIDGSESEMCGNAIRCVAKYLHDEGISRANPMVIETGRGPLTLELRIGADGKMATARVNMQPPILKSAEIPTTLAGDPPKEAAISVGGREVKVTCVSMGNPHAVVFTDADPDDEHVLVLGPQIEKHPAFPRKTNVEFVRAVSRTEGNFRVWERGSGETWACGTGACGATVAGILTGRFDRKVLMHLRGGDLEIEWSEKDGCVYMTGPATEVFRGEIDA